VGYSDWALVEEGVGGVVAIGAPRRAVSHRRAAVAGPAVVSASLHRTWDLGRRVVVSPSRSSSSSVEGADEALGTGGKGPRWSRMRRP
jgi:hypothetical protein